MAQNEGESGADTDRSAAERETAPPPSDLDHVAAETASLLPSVDLVSASLRKAYESTLDEAIPDIFLDLLRKLD